MIKASKARKKVVAVPRAGQTDQDQRPRRVTWWNKSWSFTVTMYKKVSCGIQHSKGIKCPKDDP
jgi:hypothetical protein